MGAVCFFDGKKIKESTKVLKCKVTKDNIVFKRRSREQRTQYHF